jgi:hypothetical protein
VKYGDNIVNGICAPRRGATSGPGAVELKQQHDFLPQVRPEKRRGLRYMRALLLLPVVGVLWVSSYDAIEPGLIGIPFFYWYQLVWVALSAVLTGIVYLTER